MPLHKKLGQPIAALWYTSLGAIGLSLVVLLLGSFLTLGGASCEGESCGLVSPQFLMPLILVVTLLVLAYPVLYWMLFTYELTEHTITINSGIIFRQYETIDFGRIQTIDNERGPLLMLFGLTLVRIWTASADQISFSVGNKSAEAHPQPDTTLLLHKDAAEQLKGFLVRSRTSGSSL